MKEVWYRADADYTPTNYGGGTDEFFCIKVEDEEYEEAEWNEGFNCCWGFYGELNKSEDIMFEDAGLNPDEFEEEIA